MADNNTLRKDLGPVTAYAIAVEAGFEGTQEEWVRRISSSVDQQSFDTLAASVASGDATLSDKIDTDIGTEAAARSAADTAEAAARSAADTAEATARETADTAQSGRIDALSETVAGNDTTLRNILVHKPADSYSPDGTNGQVLMTHGDGTTEWSSFGQPTPEQAAAAVSAWLDAHPEATTTVVDGSITKAKLDSELKDRVNLATNSLAPIFQQATANDPGTYVSIADRLYYLPEGHTADVTWENTTKVEVQTTSEIKNLSDDVSELKSALNGIRRRTNNLFDKYNPDIKNFLAPNTGVTTNDKVRSIVVPVTITDQTKVTVTRTVMSSRFGVARFTQYPAVGDIPDGSLSDNSATSLSINVTSAIKYILIIFYNSDYDSLTPSAIMDGIMVEYGGAFTGYREPYEPLIDNAQKTELLADVNASITAIEAVSNKNASDIDHITVDSPNLNDGIYEYGRFNSAGAEYADSNVKTAFRSKDYLPVTGGKTLKFYFDYDGSQTGIIGYAMQVVQYDGGKNIIVGRTDLYQAGSGANPQELTLNSNTAFVRFDIYKEYDDLSKVHVSLYYDELYFPWYIPYEKVLDTDSAYDPLFYGKLIAYNGDSICQNSGGYGAIIQRQKYTRYYNNAVGGAHLAHWEGTPTRHVVCESVSEMPNDADLICFEGGINDYWGNALIGELTNGYTDTLDTSTICGAMESIFRQAIEKWPGKPICFIIVHKIYHTSDTPNTTGKTFKDYHDAIIAACQKYSIPYIDMFYGSGMNCEIETIARNFTLSNSGYPWGVDGCHPNTAGYTDYYVPKLIELFRSLLIK